MRGIRVLIADDHDLFKIGLKLLLANNFGNETLIDEVSDGVELVKKALQINYDIIIVDISMPYKNGLEAIIEIKKSKPRVPILVLSAHSEEQYAIRVMKTGVNGFLKKDIDAENFVQAIKVVLKNEIFFTNQTSTQLLNFVTDPAKAPLHNLLSNREYDVFNKLAAGKSIKQIAFELNLSFSAISTYRSRILEKLNLSSTADLIKYSIEQKLDLQ